MKSFIKYQLSSLFNRLGIVSLWDHWHSHEASILMFHRIVPDDSLDWQLNHPMVMAASPFTQLISLLKKHMHIITLHDIINHRENRLPFKPFSVAITFDDGYQDNFESAFPILKKWDIPFSIFLATGYIDNPSLSLWWDEIDYYLRLPHLPTLPPAFTDDTIKKAYQKLVHTKYKNRHEYINSFIRTQLKKASDNQRKDFLNVLRNQSPQFDRSFRPMLSWKEIKIMVNSGLASCEAHTVTHPFLNQRTHNEMLHEIAHSKETIEKKVNMPCDFFSYPSGIAPHDAYSIVSRLGFKGAVTTNFSNVSSHTDIYRMGRKDARYLLLGDNVHAPLLYTYLSGLTKPLGWSY